MVGPIKAQPLLTFKTDTVANWGNTDYFFIQKYNTNTLLLSSWKTNRFSIVDLSFNKQPNRYIDSFLNKHPKKGVRQGILSTDGRGNFFRLNDGKLYYYDAQTNTEKYIFNSYRKYLGIRYKPYNDFYNPTEGFVMQYNPYTNTLFIQVQPDIPYNRTNPFRKKYNKANLLFEINCKGRLINAYGNYDSIYLQSYKKSASISYFQFIDSLKQLIITQKVSAQLQVFNLDSQKSLKLPLNTEYIKGRFSNVDSLDTKKSIEHKMKILIESPSFGAVMYSQQLKMYLVLRTDSITDTTWNQLPIVNFFQKQELKKQKSGKYCPVWSNQFWKQMALYGQKPVILQLYDSSFRFIREIQTPFPNRVQFLSEIPGEITLYSPNTSKTMYRILIQQ